MFTRERLLFNLKSYYRMESISDIASQLVDEYSDSEKLSYEVIRACTEGCSFFIREMDDLETYRTQYFAGISIIREDKEYAIIIEWNVCLNGESLVTLYDSIEELENKAIKVIEMFNR